MKIFEVLDNRTKAVKEWRCIYEDGKEEIYHVGDLFINWCNKGVHRHIGKYTPDKNNIIDSVWLAREKEYSRKELEEIYPYHFWKEPQEKELIFYEPTERISKVKGFVDSGTSYNALFEYVSSETEKSMEKQFEDEIEGYEMFSEASDPKPERIVIAVSTYALRGKYNKLICGKCYNINSDKIPDSFVSIDLSELMRAPKTLKFCSYCHALFVADHGNMKYCPVCSQADVQAKIKAITEDTDYRRLYKSICERIKDDNDRKQFEDENKEKKKNLSKECHLQWMMEKSESLYKRKPKKKTKIPTLNQGR